MCHKCLKCLDAKYIGQTEIQKSKNGFNILKHKVEKHNGRLPVQSPKNFSDPLSIQTHEAVSNRRHQGEILNSKAEFHQPPLSEERSENCICHIFVVFVLSQGTRRLINLNIVVFMCK